MRVCVGMPKVCPPLAKLSDFKDGTHNLRDCLEMHIAMDELLKQYNQAMANAN